MKSLATMVVELPGVYKSYKKFVNNNVFGEGEEVVHPGEKEQREFAKMFNADFEEEKARQKGKHSDSVATDGFASGSEEDKD